MTDHSSHDETTPLGTDRKLIDEAWQQARPTAPPGPLPKSIGPYKILQVLGEGGMGVIYLAEQERPIHRRVALKVIKLGMDTRQVIARFEAEREALALMNHPNVARVFDAGATEQGRPYFAMEYVPGIPITEYCDKHRLTTTERLILFIDVCHAIQHAHQKGIIHRDIKPTNVLVSVQDEKPVAKVIDFGVAKATQQKLAEATLFTEQGQLIGTPGYMSPEQAEMTALDIDTRTDIYSLGVLLYELLVGALPFDTESLRVAGLVEMQRIIREVEPPKPSTKFSSLGASSSTIAQRRHTEPRTLSRQLRGDLDWITMKCLEKDRTRRYDTANGLAMEIQRYLNSEPVVAGPPSAAYRLRKFVHRNRLGMTAAVAIVASLCVGLIGTTRMYFRAVAAERDQGTQRARAEVAAAAESAERQRAEANEARALAEAERANTEWEKAQILTERNRRVAYDLRVALALRAARDNNSSKLFKLLTLCPSELRGWEWYHLRNLSPQFAVPTGHRDRIRTVGFTTDGRLVFTGADDGIVKVFDIESRDSRWTFDGAGGPVLCAASRPDGQVFVTGSADGRIRVWDFQSTDVLRILESHAREVTCVAFSPDGKRLASGGADGSLAVWNEDLDTSVLSARCGDGSVEVISFAPEGSIVCGTSHGVVSVLNGTTGQRMAGLRTSTASEGVRTVLNGNGQRAFSVDWSAIRSFDVPVPNETASFPLEQPVLGFATNSAGDRLALIDSSGRLTLIDAATGLETMDFSTGAATVATAFSADGRWLAATDADGVLRLWDAPVELTTCLDSPQEGGADEDRQCRIAIDRGLAWLAAQQDPNGAFGGLSHYGPHVGITSLAGLAFLADGNDAQRGRYSHVVEGCLAFVMASRATSGLFAAEPAHGPMYGHSFAVLFLAALYKRSPSPELADALSSAVNLIENAQNAEGGWRYQPDSTDADSSVTSCQVVALRAAANVGFPPSQATLDRAGFPIEVPEYGWRIPLYVKFGGLGVCRSAASLAALLYLGEGGPNITRALKYIDQWDPTQYGIGHVMYFRYYSAQAMWLAGGARWGPWWPRARTVLVAEQAEEGFWRGQAGTEYGTAICLIVLQFPSGTLPQLPSQFGN